MSIFDGDTVFSSIAWLQEKSLAALKESAKLIDLANEPDTTKWYQKELKRRGSALVGRLIPIIALLHQAGDEAASYKE